MLNSQQTALVGGDPTKTTTTMTMTHCSTNAKITLVPGIIRDSQSALRDAGTPSLSPKPAAPTAKTRPKGAPEPMRKTLRVTPKLRAEEQLK